MSWLMHHSQSEKLASEAEMEVRKGNFSAALVLYRQSAEAELKAIDDLDQAKVRTLSVTVVSAASLFFKSGDFAQSQIVAHRWLGQGVLLPFAVEQLHQLLQKIWSEEALRKASINFTRGEVFVSVSGGEVVYGGAPLDLIHRKVDEVRNIFYRTIEFLLQVPLRTKGGPSLELQQQCRPWLFHAPAGSYQFAVRVQRPQQLQLPEFSDALPQIEEVTDKFLEIVGAAASDPLGEMVEVVPDEGYRQTFLKLTRNLAPAPDGSAFSQLEIRAASGLDQKPINFHSSSRQSLTQAITPQVVKASRASQSPERLVGVLRGLHLDKDWIEILVSGEPQRITGVKEVIDDVIGPMVNQRVIVDAIVSNGKYQFRDIQPEQ